jgi:hypothetical protein
MEGVGALYGIWWIFLLIVAILALLMPFFVFRIRNEMISMNKKMSVLIELLSGSKSDVAAKYITSSDKQIKVCPFCGAGNRLDDYSCMGCSKPI